MGAQWPPMGIEGAPNEDISVLVCSPIPFLYLTDYSSVIYKSYEHSRESLLIRDSWWIAECECVKWPGLPREDNSISRNWNAEDNKPDTYQHLEPEGNIISRIFRCCSSTALCFASSPNRCQKAGFISHIGNRKWDGQAANSMWTLNVTNSQLRDPTASTCMRRRSLHSKLMLKGDSQNSLGTRTVDSNLQGEKERERVKPEWVTGRFGRVTTQIVQKFLEHFFRGELKGQKYYKLLEILSNPNFLGFPEKCSELEEIRVNKPGNLKGTDKETFDGINWEWFIKIADFIKSGKFTFSPNRRIEIQSNGAGQTRPLETLGSPRGDKIVKGLPNKKNNAIQEAMFEPREELLESRHGFSRVAWSVHSALLEIYLQGNQYNWVIIGDISKCFYKIPHSIITKSISERIGDQSIGIMGLLNKFRLEWAGYITDKVLKRPNKGRPQGILSPLLANIVLNKLDKFMSEEKTRFDKGIKRSRLGFSFNPISAALQTKSLVKSQESVTRKEVLCLMRNNQISDAFDPNFRRMKYIRYADDFIVLIAGSNHDAKYIRTRIKDILISKCGLELNQEKTVVIRNMTKKFKFLGAEISNHRANESRLVRHSSGGRATGVCTIINAPIKNILALLKNAKLIRHNHLGKTMPTGYDPVINLSHQEILSFYNSKIRGIVNFYSFAHNKSSLNGIIWLMKASCALTLAKKYKLRTLSKVFKEFGPSLRCKETDVTFYKPVFGRPPSGSPNGWL